MGKPWKKPGRPMHLGSSMIPRLLEFKPTSGRATPIARPCFDAFSMIFDGCLLMILGPQLFSNRSLSRIKALPAEVFFIGQEVGSVTTQRLGWVTTVPEDRKLVLTFQGQLVMKDVSENLSKVWG